MKTEIKISLNDLGVFSVIIFALVDVVGRRDWRLQVHVNQQPRIHYQGAKVENVKG